MSLNALKTTALAVIVATAALAMPAAAGSDLVKVKTLDGLTTLTGKLRSYDSVHYVIETKLGTFKVEINASTCEGLACPFVMT